MKRFIFVLFVFLLLFCFVSCSSTDSSSALYEPSVSVDVEPPRDIVLNKCFFIWTDTETGVQYIVYREKSGYAGFGGITPRLNADGSLYIITD